MHDGQWACQLWKNKGKWRKKKQVSGMVLLRSPGWKRTLRCDFKKQGKRENGKNGQGRIGLRGTLGLRPGRVLTAL